MVIDIHCHILPSLDDGPKTEQESIEMAIQAIEQGIHTIIATPHHKNNTFENNRNTILKHTIILNQLFKSEGVPLTLLPGQETRINGELLKDLETGDLLPLNQSNYLFIELPFDHVPQYTEAILYDVQLKGYHPIIVHPERNSELLENPNKLYDLVHKGALTQITSGSLLGSFGKETERFTRQIIEHQLTHFIATDAHNTSSRPFNLAEAYDVIKEAYGIDTYYTFIENAEYLVANESVLREEPQRIQKRRRRLFGLF